jgi:hypothetical protein
VTQARLWPTPNATAANDGESPETWQARAEQLKAKGYNANGAGIPLAISAQMWPTPTHGDSRASGRRGSQSPRTKPGTSLSDAILKLWPTPRTITGGAESAERKQELGREESGGGDLQAAARSWPTPAARDYRSPNSAEHRAELRGHRDQLPNFVASHQGPTTPKDGAPTLSGRRVLNPRFVEALMGWPIGWTACGSLEMEWSRWWQRMRSASWRLGWEPARDT